MGKVLARKFSEALHKGGPASNLAKRLVRDGGRLEDYQLHLGFMEIDNPSRKKDGNMVGHQMKELGFDSNYGYVVFDKVGVDFMTNASKYKPRLV